MNLLSTAYAADGNAAVQPGSPWSTVVMLVVFFGIFYFLLIRPQQKRSKQQRTMLAALARHDEVVTSGGIMGKISDIEETTVTLEIVPNVAIKLQKAAIATVLPKGSLTF